MVKNFPEGASRRPQSLRKADAVSNEDELVIPPLEMKGGAATLQQYRGQVVAIVDGEVRASGKDWAAAMAAAERLGLDDPEFTYIPPYPVMSSAVTHR